MLSIGQFLVANDHFFRGLVGAAGLDGVLDDWADIAGVELKLQFSPGDSRDIEQIIDQPRFEFDVAENDGDVLLDVLRQAFIALQCRNQRKHRRKGSPQFVAERGQKMILCPAGGLGIQKLPLGADLFHDPVHRRDDQLHKILRLRNEIADSRAHGFHDARFVSEAGYQDRRHIVSFALKRPIEFEAVGGFVELIIEEEQLDLAGGQLGPGHRGAGGDIDAISGPLKMDPLQTADPRIILEHQNETAMSLHAHPHFPPLRGRRTICRNKPRRRMASMKPSYSTGFVIYTLQPSS